MESSQWKPERRAEAFAAERQLTLLKRLGFGVDGIVFATSRNTAVKAFRFPALYHREHSIYQRLRDRGITEILGFEIPEMLSAAADLWVIEMTIVRPPFVLDFAGARLDQRPEYPEDVYAEWLKAKEEQFGSRWPVVRSVMSHFASMGIYLTDVKPGNIEFAEPVEDTNG